MTANQTLPDKDFSDNVNKTFNLKRLAEGCVTAFTPASFIKGFTDSVIFKQKELQVWLTRMNGAETIIAKLGSYTPDFITAVNFLADKGEKDDFGIPYVSINLNKYKGRATLFFFALDAANEPFKIDGKESAAYNLGNLHP